MKTTADPRILIFFYFSQKGSSDPRILKFLHSVLRILLRADPRIQHILNIFRQNAERTANSASVPIGLNTIDISLKICSYKQT